MRINSYFNKIIIVSIITTLLLSTFAYTEGSNITDINGHWGEGNINILVDKGIISGYEDNTFKPNNTVNIDEYIKMIIVAKGYELENGQDYWASTYIEKGKELGIVDNSEINVYNIPINRAQMSKMLVLALDEEYSTELYRYRELITDIDSISDYYKDYVVKAYSKGLITGYEDGSFKATESLTRAESATVILRLIDESERKIPTLENAELNMTYPIVDTGQKKYYSDVDEISSPTIKSDYYSQDARYYGNQPSYTNNNDGTITDNVTGLMWQKEPNAKQSYADAVIEAENFELAGYSDWRFPTIKELYSLINFTGTMSGNQEIPYIDTDYFTFYYGDESIGERRIDSQYMSSTIYKSTTMGGQKTLFGVNFADGRIKGYPVFDPKSNLDKKFYVIYVRDNTLYGQNNFIDNQDNTISDTATGLMWSKYDSGEFNVGDNQDGGLNWEQALEWASEVEYGGHDDWRLPNAKELQSIVDYTRSPDTSNSAAIDAVFVTSTITDEANNTNYPFFWSSTTHLDGNNPASNAVYVAFGEALGFFSPNPSQEKSVIDVHGAGAQRSDPKIGDPADYPEGFGPQGDVRRIYNYVRLVRDN